MSRSLYLTLEATQGNKVDKLERRLLNDSQRCRVDGRHISCVCVYVIKSNQMATVGRVTHIENKCWQMQMLILVEKLRENDLLVDRDIDG
jgi:hypothetical protein